MSTTKISDLPVLASADAADEFVVVDDSAGVTKKITASALNGSLDASALDDYEEGTWTPTVAFGTLTFNQANYVRIGNLLYVQAELEDFSDRSSAETVRIGNFPFAFLNNFVAAGTVTGRFLDVNVHAVIANGTLGSVTFGLSPSGSVVTLQHSDLNSSSVIVNFNAWLRLA